MCFVLAPISPRNLLLALAAVILATAVHGSAAIGRQEASASVPLTLDVLALDRDGRFAEDLRPADVSVIIDGGPRRVAWVRRVSRGPGAVAEAGSRQLRSAGSVEFAAEPRRTVLVVIDQASIPRGQEREVVQAAGGFLDRLGLDDRVAVLRLPLASDAAMNLTTERPEARAALARVRGELAPSAAASAPVPATPQPDPGVSPEQARMTGIDVERRIVVDPAATPAPPGAAEGEARPLAETLDVLRAVLEGLGRLPGRKVVALFSAGLRPSSARLVDDTARTAAAAHAVVYSFGLKGTGSDGGLLTTSPLERLAASTGGSFSSLARNPERSLDRVGTELGACYVLGVEGAAGEGPLTRRAVRVETTRKGIAIRTAAWLAADPDAGDLVLASAHPAPPPGPESATASDSARPTARADRAGDLQLALARLFEYADGYERQYSMLVAEEDYRQSAPAGGVRLHSDLLLVRPEKDGDWVSFRDVFEVDGKPVRDREDRLRRLFLDTSPDAVARLNAIAQEGARYNVGAVERTVNIPLLPFSFLRPANRHRFDFEFGGEDEADGVRAWRIRYSERQRPTLIQDLRQDDVPVSGWILVETITGAVIETRMTARRGESRAEISVQYRRDPALGLWVPAEMKESYAYAVTGGGGYSGLINRAKVEGHARYSNFRRFQVTTEEKMTPPK